MPGSARKRKNTVASSNATMMVVDESPARYSPDKVTDAIMSFADFLRFLVSYLLLLLLWVVMRVRRRS